MPVNAIKHEKIKDILNAESGSVISISGPWGVGKTRFWQNFIEDNNKSLRLKKYCYVSLFGIQSLDDLKSTIANETSKNKFSENVWSFEIPNSIKRLSRVTKNANLYGVNIGGELLSSMLFESVKDTIICIDDFERLSAKLDAKDVMGLVNYLKDRKNCKIVLILHDTKAESSFHEYKEKIVDEYVVIDDCIDVLHGIVGRKSTSVTAVFNSFYDVFGVKNLRFYIKVNRLFLKIKSKMPDNISDISLIEILKSLFVFQLVHELKNFQLEESDLYSFYNDYISLRVGSSKKEIDPVKKDSMQKLHQFYNYFKMGAWQEEVFKALYKDEDISSVLIESLIESDQLSELEILNQSELSELVEKFYNLNLDNNYPKELAEAVLKNIHNENMSNLSWYCDILEKFEAKELAKDVESAVVDYLKVSFCESTKSITLNDFFRFGGAEKCRFLPVIEKLIDEASSSPSMNSMYLILDNFFKSSSWNSDVEKSILEKSTKDDWRKIIWEEVKLDRNKFVKAMMSQPISSPEKQLEIKQWIVEILEEKAASSKESKVAIDHWLSLIKKDSEQ
jgi:hypothetical protein